MRAVCIEDIPFIIKCCEYLHDESPIMRKVPKDVDYVTNRLEFMLSNGMFGVIHNDTGFMLGFVSNSWYDPTLHAYEAILYVLPQHRGGSIAYRLIKSFEHSAKSYKAKSVTVGSSVGIRDKAVEKLYETLGYKWIGNNLVKEL